MVFTPVGEPGPAREMAAVGAAPEPAVVRGVENGTLLAAGSLLTRFGVFEAGMASARDPEYTVIPQRARMAARDGAVHSVTR